MPHLKRTYQPLFPFILTRITDWNLHAKTKAWIQIENAGAQTLLQLMAWLPTTHTVKHHKDHPTLGPSFQCLQLINKNLKLTSYPGPLSPIRYNPNFTPDPSPHFQWEGWPYEQTRAKHFFSKRFTNPIQNTPA